MICDICDYMLVSFVGTTELSSFYALWALESDASHTVCLGQVPQNIIHVSTDVCTGVYVSEAHMLRGTNSLH